MLSCSDKTRPVRESAAAVAETAVALRHCCWLKVSSLGQAHAWLSTAKAGNKQVHSHDTLLMVHGRWGTQALVTPQVQ